MKALKSVSLMEEESKGSRTHAKLNVQLWKSSIREVIVGH